jgi:predicted XRE-type DNA-binding protein
MTGIDLPEHETSGGNVFADLGLADPEGHLLKARLVTRIADVIEARRLGQEEAAAILGIGEPDVSAMLRGHFGRYPAERLIRFLTSLGCGVDIVIRGREGGEPSETIRLERRVRPAA